MPDEEFQGAEKCPECGADLNQLARDSHAELHWPEAHLKEMERQGNPTHYQEARNRKNAVLGTVGRG